MSNQFSFENLDVYQRALEFSQKVLNLTREIKSHYSWCDQINRASMSIVLNIAEGAGRWHQKDKANFYYIARGSAFECVPLVDLGNQLGIIIDKQKEEMRSDLQAVCQMLTKLIQSVKL